MGVSRGAVRRHRGASSSRTRLAREDGYGGGMSVAGVEEYVKAGHGEVGRLHGVLSPGCPLGRRRGQEGHVLNTRCGMDGAVWPSLARQRWGLIARPAGIWYTHIIGLKRTYGDRARNNRGCPLATSALSFSDMRCLGPATPPRRHDEWRVRLDGVGFLDSGVPQLVVPVVPVPGPSLGEFGGREGPARFRLRRSGTGFEGLSRRFGSRAAGRESSLTSTSCRGVQMEAAGDPVVGDPHELDVAREHRVAQDCSPERIADRGDRRVAPRDQAE